MDEWKRCNKCRKLLPFADYYYSYGRPRSECKTCTIKRNVKHQRKTQAWRFRFPNDESRRAYAREYYANNKEKFASYRREFKARHPNYYKLYFQKKAHQP